MVKGVVYYREKKPILDLKQAAVYWGRGRAVLGGSTVITDHWKSVFTKSQLYFVLEKELTHITRTVTGV